MFLTAQNTSEQIASGKHAGADDYLVKPIDFDLLLATIHARLRQVQRFRSKTFVGESTPTAISPQLSKAFDFISAGIVILNHASRALFVNSAARELVGRAVCPAIITMIFYQQDQEYWQHSAIRNALVAAKNSEDYIDFIALPRSDGQRDVLLTVCTLSSVVTQQNDPALALFFCHTDRPNSTPMNALEALFQLTPMESRVAWAFAQGARPEDIADKFAISTTTVAFHKRNIFQKTQTNRQSDLVALLHTLPASID